MRCTSRAVLGGHERRKRSSRGAISLAPTADAIHSVAVLLATATACKLSAGDACRHGVADAFADDCFRHAHVLPDISHRAAAAGCADTGAGPDIVGGCRQLLSARGLERVMRRQCG